MLNFVIIFFLKRSLYGVDTNKLYELHIIGSTFVSIIDLILTVLGFANQAICQSLRDVVLMDLESQLPLRLLSMAIDDVNWRAIFRLPH